MPLYWSVRHHPKQLKTPDAFLIKKHPETKILVVQSRTKNIKVNIKKLSTKRKISRGKNELKKCIGKRLFQHYQRVENIVKGRIDFPLFFFFLLSSRYISICVYIRFLLFALFVFQFNLIYFRYNVTVYTRICFRDCDRFFFYSSIHRANIVFGYLDVLVPQLTKPHNINHIWCQKSGHKFVLCEKQICFFDQLLFNNRRV